MNTSVRFLKLSYKHTLNYYNNASFRIVHNYVAYYSTLINLHIVQSFRAWSSLVDSQCVHETRGASKMQNYLSSVNSSCYLCTVTRSHVAHYLGFRSGNFGMRLKLFASRNCYCSLLFQIA